MKVRIFIALITARILRFTCRVLRRGGTGAPGRIALKICPELLKVLSAGVDCVVVTGTNGKTTSVRIIEEGFKRAGLSYFANLTGANLIEGITTDFIMNSTLSGRCKKRYAILETDEFASREVCRQIQPKVIFVTNLFVDQVERFGGVQGTRGGLRTAIRNAPDAVLVLNADDSVSASLAEGVPNRAVRYGIAREAAAKVGYSGSSDVKECIECGAVLDYDYMTFSHLGAFRCPSCGYARTAPDYSVLEILEQDMSRSRIRVDACGESLILGINLPALYNIYNALGAFAAMIEMGIGRSFAAEALNCFNCGFGRMELLPQLCEKSARMVLIKNGAGCDQVLEFLKRYEEDFVLSIYLNNNVSDGVDVTWLETANFEALNDCRVHHIYVSGMRYQEVYARLLKAGIPEEKITKESDCKELVSTLRKSEMPVFILPTYTGMMAVRSEIVRQCGGKEYWE